MQLENSSKNLIKPRYPLTPGTPGRPSNPGGPSCPLSPSRPRLPGRPGAPLSPGRPSVPGSPGAAFLPLSPGRPEHDDNTLCTAHCCSVKFIVVNLVSKNRKTDAFFPILYIKNDLISKNPRIQVPNFYTVFRKNYTLFIFAITFLFVNQFSYFFDNNMREKICNKTYIVFPTIPNLYAPTLPCNTNGKSD